VPRRPSLAAIIAVAAALTSSTALAAPPSAGINIRWDNCFADGGVMNKAFACNTNAGVDLMVMSAQLDTGMPLVSGMEIRISLKSSVPVLPAWWEFRQSPTAPPGQACRETELTFVASPFLPAGTCVDWGQGQQVGGVGRYGIGDIGPGSAVILIASAVAIENTAALDAGTEYIVGGLSIAHRKTVGTGACGGCNTPVCILFSSLKVTTPQAPDDRLFTIGAHGTDSQIIRWQNGQIQNLVNECTGTFNCNTQFDCVNANPTAARRSTWGQVKSLYH